MKSMVDAVERFLFHPILLWLIGVGLALHVFTDPNLRFDQGEYRNHPTLALGILLLSATFIASGAAIHRHRRRDEP